MAGRRGVRSREETDEYFTDTSERVGLVVLSVAFTPAYDDGLVAEVDDEINRFSAGTSQSTRSGAMRDEIHAYV